jgi:hypothetical protein
MGALDVQVTGLAEMGRTFHRLADFQALAKPSIQAALDVVKAAQRGAMRRGPTGGAIASIGTHIHAKKWGVVGNSGPRGTGRFREGFLAALFLQSGTGLHGPLHRRIVAKETRGHHRVFAFPSETITKARFGSKAHAYTGWSRKAGGYAGRGAVSKRYANATLAFATSTAGMRPQPWAAAGRAAAEGAGMKAAESRFLQGIAQVRNRG